MPTAMHSMLQDIASLEAHECVHQVLAYFAGQVGREVHFTRTNGGDLRVRVFHMDKSQNVFTMAWRPSQKTFLCRLYTSVEPFLLPQIPAIENPQGPASDSEPLRCEFHYRPGLSNGVLINLIHSAAEQWVGQWA